MMTGISSRGESVPSGFTNPVLSAQSTFRAVMDAMARPGRWQRIGAKAQGPQPLMLASAALVLTLCDQDTPVWLDLSMAGNSDVAQWIVFHTSAPVTRDPAQAAFALIDDASALTGFNRFALGSADYPDRSTTLIVQVATLTEGPSFTLRGPGIDGLTTLRAPFSPAFVDAFAANHKLFPRGVDIVMVADDAIVALPRTTQLSVTGD